MGDYCKFPNQCGIGMDCSVCMGEEIGRLRAELAQIRSAAIYWQDRCGELEKTFSHTHKNSGNGTDTCATCGRDLRDPIHTRLANSDAESEADEKEG